MHGLGYFSGSPSQLNSQRLLRESLIIEDVDSELEKTSEKHDGHEFRNRMTDMELPLYLDSKPLDVAAQTIFLHSHNKDYAVQEILLNLIFNGLQNFFLPKASAVALRDIIQPRTSHSLRRQDKIAQNCPIITTYEQIDSD